MAMPPSAMTAPETPAVEPGRRTIQNAATGALGETLAMIAKARGVPVVNLVRRATSVDHALRPPPEIEDRLAELAKHAGRFAAALGPLRIGGKIAARAAAGPLSHLGGIDRACELFDALIDRAGRSARGNAGLDQGRVQFVRMAAGERYGSRAERQPAILLGDVHVADATGHFVGRDDDSPAGGKSRGRPAVEVSVEEDPLRPGRRRRMLVDQRRER
jgi:hypothetical protein